jgi:anti-sigma factor ChrR (cupin superfamily)
MNAAAGAPPPESAFPALAALAWKRTAWPGIRLCFLGPRDGAARGVLIAMDPGCAYPRHRHLGEEEVLVLAGEYADPWGTHRAGEFLVNAAGTVHSARAGAAGALLWARAPAGVEILEGAPPAG